tara:strand:- start:397 stop:990 length:594 start_codon:yes stop_codon:yes gene_type:complete
MERIIETKINEGDTKSFLDCQYFENIELLEKCILETQDKLIVNPKIRIFGKEATQHRSVGFFSNESIGYKFSGQTSQSIPLTPALAEILEYINHIFNSKFNGILVNRYDTGEEYIGAHSDDESKLGNSGVVALSWGATRKFRIRNKSDKKIVKDIDMNSGLLLQMGGDFQKEFTHEVPIQKKVKNVRVSLTFRKHTE